MRRYIAAVCGRITVDMKEYGMAAIAFLVYVAAVKLIFHDFCPLIIFSGFPCPGCGVTRATVCFLTGRWRQAWQLNPVVFPIMLTAVYFGVNRYLLGRKARGIKWMIAVLFVLLVITYCVRMYLYFPFKVPYVYTEENILARLWPFYQQFLQKAGIL